ncbi:hypothetical protein [Caenibius sp. WL]|uniref:hypothetical protein n=1 Tax=Caenibius sp. WL TaxID=2872646 RepID=UPI001C993EC8|nr:hypothetical protein [Caenibius sp. WL]
MREKIKQNWMRLWAWTVPHLAKAIYGVRSFGRKRAARIEIAIWLISAVVAATSCRYLQSWLSPHISAPVVASLQTLTVTIGSAIIGATAIASSFVLFAIQVNVERLPYGLFQRFSSDWKLMTAFALSFFVAIGGASLSLISKANWVAAIVMLEVGAVVAVLRLLLFAYRRSLHLVNPFQQLGLMYRRADRQLESIDRHIRWTTAHLTQSVGQELDVNRRVILDASPNWDRVLRDTIEQAVAFARRAGEQGDLEISAAALKTVVSLNQRYIYIKGRTFFANNLLIDNPLVTDAIINSTLEALRRLKNIRWLDIRDRHLADGASKQAQQVLAAAGRGRSPALLAIALALLAILHSDHIEGVCRFRPRSGLIALFLPRGILARRDQFAGFVPDACGLRSD